MNSPKAVQSVREAKEREGGDKEGRLQACGICVGLFREETMHIVRHDGTHHTIQADGQNRVGVTKLQTITFRCERCHQGKPAMKSATGQRL